MNRISKKRVSRLININSKKQTLINEDNLYLLNNDFFDMSSISLISNLKTSSESLIYQIKDNNNKCYVIKYTSIGGDRDKNSKAKIECILYSVASMLVKNNITPHLYTGILCKNIERVFIDKIPELLDYEAKILETKKTKSYYYQNNKEQILRDFKNQTQINILESDVCSFKIISLFDFLKSEITIKNQMHNYDKLYYIILILLFQLIYTLKCLHEAGIKHNDLHFNNILITYDNIFKKYNSLFDSPFLDNINKYDIYYDFIQKDDNTSYNRQYNIPFIGISTRIFDFDLGMLFYRPKISEKFKKPDIVNPVLPNSSDIFNVEDYFNYDTTVNLNNNDNPNFDILKILYSFRFHVIPDVIRETIKKLFNNFNKTNDLITLLDTGRKKLSDANPRKYNIDNYGNIINPVIFNMKPTEDILDIIYSELITTCNKIYNIDLDKYHLSQKPSHIYNIKYLYPKQKHNKNNNFQLTLFNNNNNNKKNDNNNNNSLWTNTEDEENKDSNTRLITQKNKTKKRTIKFKL